MTEWASGYVLDIQYTSGFYREIAPSHLEFAALSEGAAPPNISKDATYCELACGQGFGTNLLAAANPHMKFWGFDFNPAQIANARRLAAEAGLTNVFFEDLSFEEAVSLPPDALPQFDIIALHGIYSWISPENRRLIVQFIAKKLKPGGMVYVSYNCMPGWAPATPLQRLMREHANRNPDRSDVQAEAALAFANKLKDGKGYYFTANPGVGQRMEKMPAHNKNYLAHEYLNGHWHPLYHLDVAREMEAARLTYIGSATLAENIDIASIPPALLEVVRDTRDRTWRETLRDYASNKQFRRDIMMRGASNLPPAERVRRLMSTRLALVTPRQSVTFKFNGPLGEVNGQDAVYAPLVDALADKPKTIGQLAALPAFAERGLAAVLQSVAMLIHSGQVLVCPFDPAANAKSARQFNRAVAARAQQGEVFGFLAAPATGSGISVGYTDLLALAMQADQKLKQPSEMAALAWQTMTQTGQRLTKEGKMLQSESENLQELQEQFKMFYERRLPVWKNLGIL